MARALGGPIATSDKGRGRQILSLDGWRDWLLNAVRRVSSENAADLRPTIEAATADCGQPVAASHDPSRTGAKAIAGCQFEAIPDLLCHYRFLPTVGRKLRDGEHAALRDWLPADQVRSGVR